MMTSSTSGGKRIEDVLEYGLAGDLDKGLGTLEGKRLHALPFSGCEYDRLHMPLLYPTPLQRPSRRGEDWKPLPGTTGSGAFVALKTTSPSAMRMSSKPPPMTSLYCTRTWMPMASSRRSASRLASAARI